MMDSTSSTAGKPPQKLRALIVEDEPLAARRLLRLLKRDPSIDVTGIAQNGAEALAIIAATTPNLLLLDVEMPEVGGFELLERLPPGYAPAVIFTTAFDRYAVRAFAARATDYVLKPVTEERLGAAVANARQTLDNRSSARRLAELRQSLAPSRAKAIQPNTALDQAFWVRERGELIRVDAADVVWLEAQKDYVRLHTRDRNYLTHGILGHIASRLDPTAFVRVHRSAVVRTESVKSLRRGRFGALDLVMADGAVVRVGRKYLSALKERLPA